MSNTGRVLGVDYGDVRTGIAMSDPTRLLASAFCTLKESGMRHTANKIAQIAKENNVTMIVVGLPKNMDGTEGPRAEVVLAFCALLGEATDIEIVTRDERLSTVQAYRMMDYTQTFGKKRKDNIDALSAQIILQDWLDAQRIQTGGK